MTMVRTSLGIPQFILFRVVVYVNAYRHPFVFQLQCSGEFPQLGLWRIDCSEQMDQYILHIRRVFSAETTIVADLVPEQSEVYAVLRLQEVRKHPMQLHQISRSLELVFGQLELRTPWTNEPHPVELLYEPALGVHWSVYTKPKVRIDPRARLFLVDISGDEHLEMPIRTRRRSCCVTASH
jgi:hypothetical protein